MNVDIHKEINLGKVTDVYDRLKLFKKWSQKRIMVVDDEEFCIAIMKALLDSCGFNSDYEIDFCINGQECLDKVIQAYEHGMSYGIIFTDFSMPVLNGIDATLLIRNYLKN